MAYAAMKKEILNFESGLVYELALKYPAGKPVSNGRVMFTTATEEVFFLDPFDADAIAGLNLKPGEKFRLVKHGRNIEISCIAMEQPVIRPAAPVAVIPEQKMSTTAEQTPQQQPLSRIMASSYIAAIDALLIARDYAEAKGIQFKLSPQELRSAAHCIFIACSRGGR